MLFKIFKEKALTSQNFKVLSWVVILGIFLMSVESAWASNALQEGGKNVKSWLSDYAAPIVFMGGAIVGLARYIHQGNILMAGFVLVLVVMGGMAVGLIKSDTFLTTCSTLLSNGS